MSVDARPRCAILGGGGHARVLLDCVRASGIAEPVAILDTNPALWGTELFGVPIMGGDERLSELAKQGIRHFVVGLGGVGDNRARKRLFELAIRQGLVPLSIAHPSAICSPSAQLGPGSVLFPLAVVNAGARLGMNVIVNTGAIVEHDCQLSDHVHVATGARLCSTVCVGDQAHIGAGAVVRQCVSIGHGAIVGAGAVVVEDVSPDAVVAGVPARPMARREAHAWLAKHTATSE